jgi:hypothetical protein
MCYISLSTCATAGAGVDAETPIYIDEDDNPIANGGESDPEAFQ